MISKLIIRELLLNNRCDNSLKVRIAAFQAVGPGSIPGCRNVFLY